MINLHKRNIAIVLALIVFASLSVMVRAGSLTPTSNPGSTMYTLNDVYVRLTTNAGASEGNHVLSSSLSLSPTMHTLKEIYEAIPTIVPNTVKLGTSYLGISGTLTPDGGTATTSDLFNGETSHLTNDWNLDTGTLNLACNTSIFDGTSNKVSDAYDGDGNGANRWCMTDSGNATASSVLAGKTAWVNGAEVAGNYNANLYSGTGKGFTGESQANGGIDDYNGGGDVSSGRYEKGWTQCTSGNNYCGTGSLIADARDDSTGLVWSLPCNGVGCTSFSDAAPLTYTWDTSGTNNNAKAASQLCSDAGWFLPHQKQFMMAYVDGSYGNLEAIGTSLGRVYWSATTLSYGTPPAWNANLSSGYINTSGKTGNFYVRCVVLSQQ